MRSVPDHVLSRSLAVLVAATLTAAAALAGLAPAAVAEEATSAPIVIADVHTDAISTFWDDGELVLASKADTPALHTRYEAADVWFHVDNDSKIASFPAGYDFVAPAGTTVWLAPEVQQPNQIWPGFSTESVPLGTLDNDDTTLTLVGVDGPGDVELWQTGSFGAAQRLWSSDEAGFKSFTRKNVHMHANWAFTAAGTYHLTVKADAAVAGAPVSATAIYTFVVGDLPEDPGEPTVDFNVFPEEFVHGQQYTLTATTTGNIEGATYRWELLQTGATDWYTISNAEGPIDTADLTFTAQQSWDGFLWRVALLDSGGTRIAQSEPREMHVSLPTPTEDGLHILGLAGHYHSGNPISLNAVLVPADEADATYRWSVKRADQGAYHLIDGVDGDVLTLTAEQALDGALIRVERLVEGTVTTTSEPVTVEVDDHGAPAPQVVSISGGTQYHEGDSVTLAAQVTPASVLDRYQWYLTAAGSTTPQPIDGATSATYTFPAAAAHNGAAVTVAVTGENGAVAYGPSAPHLLVVTGTAPAPGPVATTITAVPVTQTYGKTAQLVVSVSPNATGQVAVGVGAHTVTATLANGEAMVTLPKKALAPGKRSVSISYAGVSGTFKPATGTATVNVAKAQATVKVKPIASMVKRGATATFQVRVSASGVIPGGKVTVKIAGRKKTVQLNANGKLTVKLPVARAAKPGKRTVTASYGGDAYVAKAAGSATVKVTR